MSNGLNINGLNFEASLLLDWSHYKCLILLENCDWVRWLLW